MTFFEQPATLCERQFLHDVWHGLEQEQKTLPSKYFYDDRGSQLFEEICQLDEYYLTRTETQVLTDYSEQIVPAGGDGLCLIEPGAGAGKKAALLFANVSGDKRFVPIEISTEALNMAGSYLTERFPDLDLHPIHGDFTDADDMAKVSNQLDEAPRLVFFPGSTLGNFDADAAREILANLRRLLREQDSLVIGLDLFKNETRLLHAYDDARGVTAEFNKNILHRINKELDADFDVDHGFRHLAKFNSEQNRIEMHLVACSDQAVTVAGREFNFNIGETIHTENSHKYSIPKIKQLCHQARLTINQYWQDPNADFGVFRLIKQE